MRAFLMAWLVATGAGCNGSHRGHGGIDAGPCPPIHCTAPPMGCRYVVDPSAPCACGALECDEGVDGGPCVGIRCPGPRPGCFIVSDGSCCGHEECELPPDAGPTGGVCCGVGCDPPFFPSFARDCGADADCVVGLHQVDCCGTYQALGISSGERTAFNAAEAECASMYPACGCAPGPTTADDGTTCFEPSVRCVGGACTTTCEAAPPAGCSDYCAAITDACVGSNAQYGSFEECIAYCDSAGWRPGTPGDTSGDSLACRRYHAGAATTSPTIHCPHAGPTGAGVCID